LTSFPRWSSESIVMTKFMSGSSRVALVKTGVRRELGAEEACRIGYATEACSSEDLMEKSLELARVIRGMARDGVRMLLAHLNRHEDMSRDESLRWAALVPGYLGVEQGIAGKEEELLGKK
jgi:enoyl-CoA hydratase/carnithine racemase